MTERKINLDEILLNELEKSKYGFPEMDSDVYDNIKTAMKEACRQLLELAAENTELYCEDKLSNIKYITNFEINNGLIITVNKQSILDTIKQVK